MSLDHQFLFYYIIQLYNLYFILFLYSHLFSHTKMDVYPVPCCFPICLPCSAICSLPFLIIFILIIYLYGDSILSYFSRFMRVLTLQNGLSKNSKAKSYLQSDEPQWNLLTICFLLLTIWVVGYSICYTIQKVLEELNNKNKQNEEIDVNRYYTKLLD